MADSRREWLWAGVALVVVLIVVAVLAPPGSQTAFDQRLSTLRTTPDGAGALYETLEALGVPVERRLTPLAGVDRIRGPLAILDPVEPLSPTELDSLFEWVERGGRLIVSPPLGLAFQEHLGLALSWEGDATPVVAGRHRWTEGVDSIGSTPWVFHGDSLDAPSLTPLVVDSRTGAPIVGLLPRGEGEILALTDGRLLSNERIRAGGLAPLVVRAAAEWTGPDQPLWFDEYHHGHRGGSAYRALVGMLTGGPAGRAALQLMAVALLALVPAAIRFGAPRPDGPPSRRSRLEHVEALGAMYRQAGAEELARRRVVAGLARRIRRDRPLQGKEAAFLERLERHAVTGAGSVAAVSAALDRGAPLLELADRIDEAVHQLNRAP